MQSGFNVWMISPFSTELAIFHNYKHIFVSPYCCYTARPKTVVSEVHIWMLVCCRALADVDGDGRVDRREFSIAMYLIKHCLHGHDLPVVLPSSLKVDPVGVQTCSLLSDRSMSSVFGMPCSAVRPLAAPHGWFLIDTVEF